MKQITLWIEAVGIFSILAALAALMLIYPIEFFQTIGVLIILTFSVGFIGAIKWYLEND